GGVALGQAGRAQPLDLLEERVVAAGVGEERLHLGGGAVRRGDGVTAEGVHHGGEAHGAGERRREGQVRGREVGDGNLEDLGRLAGAGGRALAGEGGDGHG